jgi:23S rRNA (guanosine2251-2'-O)-methyltransferase
MATRGSAPLSPAAIKASAGAVEHLLVSRVESLADELTALRLRGIRVVGAEAEAAQDHRSADLRGPICLVIGSEGKGLSPAIRRRIDLYVRIPMVGKVASLNASVAGSILLFEVLGQRPATAQGVPPTSAASPLPAGDEEASK